MDTILALVVLMVYLNRAFNTVTSNELSKQQDFSGASPHPFSPPLLVGSCFHIIIV